MKNLLAVNSNWLDTNPSGTLTTGTVAYSNCVDYWPKYSYYPVYYSSPARPIKLTLSEVERLRLAAKDDAKLKAILQKFTTQIEITVDFD